MSSDLFILPIHPSEILKEEFLDPMGIFQRGFARHIDVPANRVNQIINGKRGMTGDTNHLFWIGPWDQPGNVATPAISL